MSRRNGSRDAGNFESESPDSEDFSPRPKEPNIKTKKPNSSFKERRFSKVQKVVSDVFKLLAAPTKKQVGIAKHPDIDPGDWKDFEHCHIFRTFDTEGRRHEVTAMQSGHFHKIEWDYDDKKNPVIASISAPLQWVQKKQNGKWVKVMVPLNDFDFHTHDFEYLNSHEVSARVKNLEAEKVIVLESTKGANPGGVLVK